MTEKPVRIHFLTPSRQTLVDLLRQVDSKTAAIWSCDCAERVLPLFESLYPLDHRPRRAIEAGRTWARGQCKVGFCRSAAWATHAAARDVGPGAACFAARAAGHAAATAHVTGHAIGGADYAVKALVVSVHEAQADQVNEAERTWQKQHLLDLIAKLSK